MVGEYKDRKYEYGEWRPLDLGAREAYYAPTCFKDAEGRWIMWSWILGPGTEGYPWNGCLSIPRELSLNADGMLCQEPVPEIDKLLGKELFNGKMELNNSKEFLEGVQSSACELNVEIDIGNSEKAGCEVLIPDNGDGGVRIEYNAGDGLFSVGERSVPLILPENEDKLDLRIFIDRSVIEVYINSRDCFTARAYPDLAKGAGIAVYAEGGSADVAITVREMGEIWI